ncbi:MAG: hypothetical protein JWO72_956 [Caulobacteraceae bacterium]|nr:hypothetical protein [Caulobacteraceae bacterium]
MPEPMPTPREGPRRRWMPAAALVALSLAVATLWLAGGVRPHTLDLLRLHAAGWRAFSHMHPAAGAAIFVAAYAAALVVLLPVALAMTAASGFLFGPLLGAAASMAGATLGAALAYGLAHTVVGRAQARPARRADRLDALLAGMKADAFRYVLSLRLMPLTPFTLVSIAAGLARAPLGPFLLGTLLGVLPESLVYAAVGAGLGDSVLREPTLTMAAFARPGLLWPLAALAALVLAWRLARPAAKRP